MLSTFSPQRLLCPEFNSLPRLLSDNFSTLTSKYLWERHFIFIPNHFHVLHWHLFTFSTNLTNALDKNPTWRSSTNRQKKKIASCLLLTLFLRIYLKIAFVLFDPLLQWQLQSSCLSIMNPYIIFSYTSFSRATIFLLFFLLSILFSQLCKTSHLAIQTGGVNQVSQTVLLNNTKPQCCNAVSLPLLLKSSLEILPPRCTGKS